MHHSKGWTEYLSSIAGSRHLLHQLIHLADTTATPSHEQHVPGGTRPVEKVDQVHINSTKEPGYCRPLCLLQDAIHVRLRQTSFHKVHRSSPFLVTCSRTKRR